MQKICSNSWCKQPFEVLEEDKVLLKQFDVPEPNQCVYCRHIHRSMFRETISFHKRKSSLSGEPILSIFREDLPFPVYSIEEWWSDKWDDLEHGRKPDFSRPFFEQFIEMYNSVPKMANFNENCENCEYCSSAGSSKNCYYCERVYRSENCYHSEAVTGYNSSLCDCLRCQRSERLYECIQCFRCHSSTYLYRSSDISDSHFCSSLRNCQNCLFCHNLQNKQFHIHNKPVSKEEFEEVKKKITDGKYSTLKKNLKKWKTEIDNTIWKDLNNINAENCRGDALTNASRCFESYDCINSENLRYCWDLSPSEKVVQCMDVTGGGIGELQYNSTNLGGGNYSMRMCIKCRQCSDCTYCVDCYSCKDCFGCTGLKAKRYCILNMQYTQKEYEELKAKLTEHMRKTNEWGEFFPLSLERFAYNESKATYYDKLSKEDVLARGWQWRDPEDEHTEVAKAIPAEQLPDSIDDIPDDIVNWAIICPTSGRRFRLIQQELSFYRDLHLPIPREHPNVRMERRRKLINPYRLFHRKCSNCKNDIETSYPPESKAIVYCESCYLKSIY